MTCDALVKSQEIMDFIIYNNPWYYNYNPSDKIENACVIEVDENFSIGYGKLSGDMKMSISNLGYQTIPKLYGIMDTSSMDAAGITSSLNQPFLNVRGQGVIMGIVDTGIDYTHEAFKKSPNVSRIAVIWDQTGEWNNTESQESRSDYISSVYKYGRVFTNEEINAALKAQSDGGNPYEYVPEKDTDGHGTFIAGIAAGSQTDEFCGAAPECELAVIKLKEAKDYLKEYFLVNRETAVFEETDIMLGVRFLLDYAAKRKMPLVICFGLGTGSGPRTGATPLASMLSLVAIRTNVVVVSCMGNEAAGRTHISGEALSSVSPYTIELNVGKKEKGFSMEIWANTLDVLSVSVISPSGESVPRLSARTGMTNVLKFIFENSQVEVDYRVVDTLSGYEVIFFRFINPAQGVWKINVYSLTNIKGSFNGWLPINNFLQSDTFFLNSTPDTTLTEPAAESRIISIASYNHLTGAISIESGRGYSADNVVKPELAAPGVNVYGPRIGGGYTYRSGTSIAAAHAAGAAALLLTWGVYYGNAKYLGTNDVKYILIRGAVRDESVTSSGSEEFPNNIWGYGRLNLINSFLELRVT